MSENSDQPDRNRPRTTSTDPAPAHPAADRSQEPIKVKKTPGMKFRVEQPKQGKGRKGGNPRADK